MFGLWSILCLSAIYPNGPFTATKRISSLLVEILDKVGHRYLPSLQGTLGKGARQILDKVVTVSSQLKGHFELGGREHLLLRFIGSLSSSPEGEDHSR